MALFIASLFNYFTNPDPLDLTVATQSEIDDLHYLRMIEIPLTHGVLMVMCFIVNSDRIQWEEVKQGLNFIAMILQINMILAASLGMNDYNYPIPNTYPKNLAL